MLFSRSTLICVVAIGVIAVPAWVPAAGVPNDEASVRHALNRLTFGPRPGDVDRVQRAGLAAWIEAQLRPSTLDDRALDVRLLTPPPRPDRFDSMKEARQYTREAVQTLAANKLIRATFSERQLEEVLVDFWFNHFNVFARKGRTGLYVEEYERDAIRPHVLGSFRELLGATAKSPAMLFYLDNWLNGRRDGVNENYARELLELHTLGVDGGYTQQDVANVARAFTGWTFDPRADGRFRFARRVHQGGDKVVLGQRIRDGGIDEGERVLDLLAAHPATARHIARALAQRFVSDDPPATLVARVAQRFQDTHGDLRETMRTLVTAPEFFAAETRGAKVKTPIEFVVSAYRTTGRDLAQPGMALRALQQLGQVPYMCEPPTGYDDTADAWVNAGALVARVNIAQQIAGPQATAIAGPEFQRR